MAVCELKIPCSKLQGIFDRKECGLFYDSLAFAVQTMGRVGALPGWGDGLKTERVSGIFLEEIKRTRLAWRISGGVIASAG